MAQRHIQTTYYRGKEVVQINRSTYAFNAVPNAVRHMQTRNYDATACEVFDSQTGELHAVLRLPRGSSQLTVLFKREVEEGK